MKECIEFLDFQEKEMMPEVRKILATALEMSETFERMYLDAPCIHELSDHNRVNTADVTVAMSLQMVIETE